MNVIEVKELIYDIQTGGDKILVMTDSFPDSMKGNCAKRLWNDSTFAYGIEYGALIILNHLLKLQSSKESAKNAE